MGKTEKSQMIKTIKELFELCNESHHFVVLASTSTAVALLNEDTYHHFLGLRTEDPKDDVMINEHVMTSDRLYQGMRNVAPVGTSVQ
jgi:hypothetical protein